MEINNGCVKSGIIIGKFDHDLFKSKQEIREAYYTTQGAIRGELDVMAV